VRKSLYSREHERLVTLLRDLRLDAGLTQTAVARKLRRPQSFVSKYESGQRRLDLVELKAVCEALGTDLVSFVSTFEGHS
jgi:transcriptional regulator with XRE-family HTH domain